MKAYDRAYFDRWYRDPRHRVRHRGLLERKVRLAVSVTEYLLDRPLASVLDVGCGEGEWQPVLKRLRPCARYLGVDSSRYAIERYGKRRNLKLGTLATLGRLGLEGPYDLIVCSDVLHYAPTPDVRRALAVIRRLLGGVAFIEVFAREDASFGDEQDYRPRRAALYAELFRAARLAPVGLHCFVGPNLARVLTSFERRARRPSG